MRPVRTIVTALFAATIAVTGCTHPSADQPAPPPPTPDITHPPTPPTHQAIPPQTTPPRPTATR